MQSMLKLFSEDKDTYDQKVPLLLADEVKHIVDRLTDHDLLNTIVTISNTPCEYNEEHEAIFQIRKLKSLLNTKIGKNALIIFSSNTPDDVNIAGSKEDECSCCNGMLIGMIENNVNLMKNVDTNIQITLLRNDGTIEYRDLYASHAVYDGCDLQAHDEWRFWLLTTGDHRGFYADFLQSQVYIIFPNHPYYEKFKMYAK